MRAHMRILMDQWTSYPDGVSFYYHAIKHGCIEAHHICSLIEEFEEHHHDAYPMIVLETLLLFSENQREVMRAGDWGKDTSTDDEAIEWLVDQYCDTPYDDEVHMTEYDQAMWARSTRQKLTKMSMRSDVVSSNEIWTAIMAMLNDWPEP